MALNIGLAGIVILLFPMAYFLLSSPAFLLVTLDKPVVAQLLRGQIHAYFVMVAIAGSVAMAIFALTGHPELAAGVGLLAVFAVLARRWFLKRIDSQRAAREAGDRDAIRQFRRLHVAGMLLNVVQIALVGTLPGVF